MLEKILKRSSWADILISAVFMLFGILLIAKPQETIGALAIIVGILFITVGVLKLIEYFTSEPKEDYLLSIALISVIFGVIMLFASDQFISVAKFIVGIWIIAAGVIDFQTAVTWKELKSPYWTISVIFSFFIMIAGIYVMVEQSGAMAVALGIAIVVYSVLDIIDRIIFMRKIDNFTK